MASINYKTLGDSNDEESESDGSNRPRELLELYAIISALKAPGTFACGGTLPSMYPGRTFLNIPDRIPIILSSIKLYNIIENSAFIF